MSGLLVIGAHPDDCEHIAGGVAANTAAAGEPVAFLVVTNGELWHADKQVTDPNDIAQTRRREAAAGAAVLGATVHFAELPDSSLTGHADLAATLAHFIRQIRPTTVVTHSPNEGHYDHKAVATTTLRICNVEGEPSLIGNARYRPDLGPAHDIERLYFAAQGADLYRDSAVFIDTSEALDTKIKALKSHGSQSADLAALDQRVRLTAASVGRIMGMDAAEAFYSAPGYRPVVRYIRLP
jgi:LmbE family N-acetylglucosaminyl deacetylase